MSIYISDEGEITMSVSMRTVVGSEMEKSHVCTAAVLAQEELALPL
jgi:hypothetical protein